MQFSVRFYYDADGNKPVFAFLENLRKQDRILHKLVVAGIKKLEMSERHRPPLTQLVDQKGQAPHAVIGRGLRETRPTNGTKARVIPRLDWPSSRKRAFEGN